MLERIQACSQVREVILKKLLVGIIWEYKRKYRNIITTNEVCAFREGAYLSQLIWSCPQSHSPLLCSHYLPLFQELCAHEETEFEHMTGQANTHWGRNAGLSGSAADTPQQVCGENREDKRQREDLLTFSKP